MEIQDIGQKQKQNKHNSETMTIALSGWRCVTTSDYPIGTFKRFFCSRKQIHNTPLLVTVLLS